MPAGQPTKYKPEYCDKLIEHMSKGLSYQSFPALLDTCLKTVYNWEKEHPEFLQAKVIGRQKQQLFYEDLGAKASTGKVKNFNATAFVWMSKNMLGWRDRQDIELSGKDGGPIKSVAMNINADAQSLTDKELRDAVIKIIQGESANDTTNERTITSGVSDSLRLPG